MNQNVFPSKRYVLEEVLRADAAGMIYRAFDRLHETHVRLQMVPNRVTQAAFARRENVDLVRLALGKELAALAALRYPHLSTVLDYGFDRYGQLYFTTVLLTAAPTILEVGQGKPLAEKTTLLMQALMGLAHLHRRGIVHRDLRPAHVVWVEGRIQVLNAGVAGLGDPEELILGNLMYIAPEMILGEGSSCASDLYAFGIIAYEVLTERPALKSTRLVELAAEICGDMPDMHVLLSRYPETTAVSLQKVLEKMLAKNVVDRYNDPVEALRDLCDAAGRFVPLDADLLETPYLYAHQIVGRELEMATIKEALSRATRRHGSLWVLAGPNGVGKTRLCTELAQMARVWNVAVIRAAAAPVAGAVYGIWREPLCRLALEGDLTAEQAAAIEPLVPDIFARHHLEKAAPATDNAPLTFEQGITKMLAGLPRPLLMIFDDLQWADTASLGLLHRLGKVIEDLPVLMIGIWDTGNDAPPAGLSANKLQLDTFDSLTMRVFAQRILGAAADNPEVMALLEQRSEGNPLILMEIMRALTEDAGRTSAVGQATLIFPRISRGESRYIMRRVQCVPPAARYLLQIAALSGMRVDLAVMQALASVENIQEWIGRCAEVMVVEYHDENWWFAHERLREGVLNGIDPKKRPDYHRRLAEAISSVYGDKAPPAALAYHWREAGDETRAADFRRRAEKEAALLGAAPA